MVGVRAASDRGDHLRLAARVTLPVADAVYAVVALHLGLEMLSHLDGDRTPALAVFDQASQLAAFFAGASGSSSEPKETR